MPSSVSVRREGGNLIAVLDRPEKLNALSRECFQEFERLLDVLETDKTARVLIITGAGDKAFCVGADLKERLGMNEKDILHRLQYVRNLYLRFQRLPVPVICVMNGIALGGGLELALTADLRIATDNATMGLPEVSLAIIPGSGGTQRLSRVVGVGKALEMILLAKRVSAAEALQMGLVHRVVPQGKGLSAALEWSEKISEMGPVAIAQAKRAILMGQSMALEDALSFELDAYQHCLHSKDRLEGLKAFAEKRKPNYRGE